LAQADAAASAVRAARVLPSVGGLLRTAGARLPYAAHLLNAAYAVAAVLLAVFAAQSRAARGRPAFDGRTIALALIAGGFLIAILWGGRGVNAVLCVLASGGLAVGQIALHPRRVADYPASATRDPAPYVMFTGLAGEEGHNELGYRGRAPSMPKADEYRVLMIGGSAVYGKGPLSLTLPAQLQRLARHGGSPQVSVYNWGVVSQVSGQELATLAHRAGRFAPDLLVVYDGGNDFYSSFTGDPRPGYPFNFVLTQRAVDIFQAGDWRTLAAAGLTQSNLLRAAFPVELSDAAARVEPIRRAAGYGTPEWEERVAGEYLANVETECRLAGGLGARLAVFLQPVVYFSRQADRYTQMGADFRAYVERGYDRVRKGLAGLAERHAGGGCVFVDLSRACARGECEFQDYIHPSPETRAPIADAMFTELRARGLLPPAAR
jgi:hypothetical protein